MGMVVLSNNSQIPSVHQRSLVCRLQAVGTFRQQTEFLSKRLQRLEDLAGRPVRRPSKISVGKMRGKPLGMEGPLRINPINTPYIVGIYWVYPLLKGSLGGLNS